MRFSLPMIRHGLSQAMSLFSLRARILVGFVFVEAVLVVFILATQTFSHKGNPSFNRYEAVALEARMAERIAGELQAIMGAAEKYVATGDRANIDRAMVLTIELGRDLHTARDAATSPFVTQKIEELLSTLSTFLEKYDRLVDLRTRYSTALRQDVQPSIEILSAELTLLAARAWNNGARDVAVEVGHTNEALLLVERQLTVFVDQPGRKTVTSTSKAIRQLNRQLEDLRDAHGRSDGDADSAEQIVELLRLASGFEKAFDDLARNALSYRNVTRQFVDQNLALANEEAKALADHASAALIVLGRETRSDFAAAENQKLLYAIGALGISLIFALLVGGDIANRIRRIASVMQELARGNLNIDLDGLDQRHELGDMTRSIGVFKDNVQRIEAMTSELQNKALLMEIALQREQEVNAKQREFVAMVSHEFRTPLAIISGTARRIGKCLDPLSSGEALERLEDVKTAVIRLTNLIESTLNASRLEEGEYHYEPDLFDVRDLIRDGCRLQNKLTPNHIIKLDIDDLPDALYADQRLLQQVITNLLSNAAKYAPAQSMIAVKGWTEQGKVFVSVADQGVGIPKSDLSKLFDRFFRARTSIGVPGAGIGLYLVKRLIEMHGGDIDVESEEGVGSTFTIWLPMADDDVTLWDDQPLDDLFATIDEQEMV